MPKNIINQETECSERVEFNKTTYSQNNSTGFAYQGHANLLT